MGDCDYEGKSIIAYVTGGTIIVGVFISYIAQIAEISVRKSSAGISWVTIFLANAGGCATLLNAVFDQWSTLVCCRDWEWNQCVSSTLSVLQIASGWISVLVLYVVFLWFYPKFEDTPEYKSKMNKAFQVNSERSEEELSTNRIDNLKKEKEAYDIHRKFSKVFWWVYVGFFLFFCTLLGFGFLAAFGKHSPWLKGYVYALGIVATISVIVQWSPQIWKTWVTQDVGALSIPMILLQTPGSFLIVVFQGFLYQAPVITWLPFFVCGVEMVILLVLCVGIRIKESCRAKKKVSYASSRNSSMKELRAPLLSEYA
mmetsp:Transcript_26034/g.36627  ORF Transcript_26034/g.36627 Transcript_26034/m.36627 type:complete len:313 (-) Transcript_26034:2778-3716(-)